MAREIAYALRALIEGITIVFSIYIFSYEKADWKVKTGLGLFLGVVAYVVRLLPIHLGVHTLIIVLICIFALMGFGKIEFYNAASSTITIFIILYLSEWMITIIFTRILDFTIDTLFKSITGNIISYIPLAITFGVVIVNKRLENSKNKVVFSDRAFKNDC